MAIQSMSLQEAIEGGYEIVGPDPIERTAPPTLAESAISMGLDILFPIAFSAIGSLKGPAGTYAGGAAGGALGNFLSQNYRIARGLKDDFGTAELASSTVLSGLGLGKLANKGMAAKTAIRAGQGSALATADLLARSYIDEDRAPTQEELASTILFGGVLGGGLGAAEAKWFSDTTGVSVNKNDTRPDVIDTLTLSVKEAGGPRQFDATQKTGYFTFRDPRGNFVFNDPVVDELTTTSGLATNNALGPRRLNRLDQAELPGPRGLPGSQQKQLTNRTGRPGDDAVVIEAEVLDAMSPREYAEGLLSGIESKLLLETTEQVRNLAKTADTTPEIQSLKNLFEQKIASDSEIFTGVNPIVAKGEIAKRSLEKKNGIKSRSFLPLPKDGPFTMDNILPAAVGMAAIADIMTDEDEDNIAQAGGWGLALAAVAKVAGVKMSKASRKIKEGAVKGQAQNAKDNAIRAKGGTPKKPAEPKGKQADRTNIANYQKDELFEMIQDANQPSMIKEQAIAVLAERASRNTASGQRLRRELEELANTGRATNTKVKVDNMPAELTTQRGIQSAASVPISEGIQTRTNKQLVQDAIGGSEFSLQELRRRAAKNPRTKKLMDKNDLITGLLTTGAGASGVISLMLDEEDDTVSKAMMGGGELLVALALATLGYKGSKKFFKSPQGKKLQAQTRKNPEAAEPVDIKMQSVKNTNERNAFIPPGKVKKAWRDFSGIVSDALDPLSRKLKKISPAIAQAIRSHDKEVSKKTAEFINRGSPFLVSMSKLLKDKPELQERLHNHLLNGEYNEIATNILDKVNAPTAVYKEMKQMRDVLNEVREYARERGGIDVGYIEDYFPRIVADYKSFREALASTRNVEVKNQIDTALEEYAKKNNIGTVEQIPESEAAEVVSRVLRGYPQQQGMTPGSAKMRKIQEVDGQMAAGYKKPGEAFTEYIERMVQATERRNFFYRKARSASTVGFQGSKDRLGADLGSKMEVADGISSVVMRLQKENNLSSDDVDMLQRLIEARFSSQAVGPAFQVIKNINYISTMGNFGSAVTQLGDLAYSFHFNGFDNTFQSMFNKKIDFVKMFGLTNVNTDLINSPGITAKVLDNVFTVTGLKKLDQFAKNTTMNAIWRKQKQLAAKDANALLDDLRPTFGDDLSRQMVRELQSSNPNSQNLPKAVEELIWYKFLDLNPATLTEMPTLYNKSGNGRIAYMLKSFTLKQFDVFRQAGIDDIQKAKTLYSQGKKEQAANLATKGVGNLLKLGMVFAAANATTDVIKDTMYGRPTKPDDLVVNNLLKLLGVNRYMAYEFQRKGLGSVVGQTILPPFTVFDRASRDLSDIYGGGPIKGNLLQGTPLDVIYWHYLGGLDKVERMK